MDITSILSLFTSFSTLLCCALPALLVTLGLGAVMAGLVSDLPFLRTLSLYKEYTFSIATLLIGFNLWLVYRKGHQVIACEITDEITETVCETASRWSKVILWISIVFLFIGFFMAYLLLPLIRYFES